jgi:hypothetical protein
VIYNDAESDTALAGPQCISVFSYKLLPQSKEDDSPSRYEELHPRLDIPPHE